MEQQNIIIKSNNLGGAFTVKIKMEMFTIIEKIHFQVTPCALLCIAVDNYLIIISKDSLYSLLYLPACSRL